MNKANKDPKVKKTLVRNCEQKGRIKSRTNVIREVDSCQYLTPAHSSLHSFQQQQLNVPSMCSSEVFADFLTDVKSSAPPPLTAVDLNADRGELCAKMTKKLNFHFNNSIYKNLIELNASIEELKTKKEKRPIGAPLKRDLEPNIEDFCDDEKEMDSPPNIPMMKPKFRPVKRVEHGQLHRLVASFEL